MATIYGTIFDDNGVGLNYAVGGTGGADKIFSMTGNDLVVAGGGNDSVYGFFGNDTIWGDSGADQLHGEGNDDLLYGGAGGDVLDGGDGFDAASYAYAAAGVAVDLAIGYTAGEASGDSFIGIERVVGTEFADTFSSGSGVHDFAGFGGDDYFFATSSVDHYDGGTGMDTVSFSAGTTGVNVNLAAGTGHGGIAEGDTYVAMENLYGTNFADTVIGTSADNSFFGSGGADHLSGYGGNDVIRGGMGQDQLWGGDDNDTFVFAATSESGAGQANRDLVMDFAPGDHIDLHSIDASLAGSSNGDFTFIGHSAFSGEGQVRWTVDSHDNTIISVNTSGNGGAEMQIELHGLHELHANDFIL